MVVSTAVSVNDGDDDDGVKYRAANVRLPKLPANKTAAAIAERRQMLRAKEAQVHLHSYKRGPSLTINLHVNCLT